MNVGIDLLLLTSSGKVLSKNPILKSSSCSDPRNICHRRITPT